MAGPYLIVLQAVKAMLLVSGKSLEGQKRDVCIALLWHCNALCAGAAGADAAGQFSVLSASRNADPAGR